MCEILCIIICGMLQGDFRQFYLVSLSVVVVLGVVLFYLKSLTIKQRVGYCILHMQVDVPSDEVLHKCLYKK